MGKKKQKGKQKGNKQKVIFVELVRGKGRGHGGEQKSSGQVCPFMIGHMARMPLGNY